MDAYSTSRNIVQSRRKLLYIFMSYKIHNSIISAEKARASSMDVHRHIRNSHTTPECVCSTFTQRRATDFTKLWCLVDPPATMFSLSDLTNRTTCQEVQAKLGSCRSHLYLKSRFACVLIVDFYTSCTTVSRHAESNDIDQPD